MEQFGKYQLIRRVGAGGMAEVYLARTTVAQGLNKQLVIKKIHPAYARSKQFMTMFIDEAKIALSLNHPNIVQVFDFGQVGETFFLAMEYIEGMDVLRVMQDRVRAGKAVPLNIAVYIVQQVAKGLDYAHRKSDEYGEALGIVHRDISPQNVLVSWDGAVKIVDFGIARARDIKEEEGVIKGKFAYMAPEQARGQSVDRRADVFSAGVVLFELCCGRPLFLGKGKEVLEQAKAGAIPSPRKLNPEIPKELEATILRALSFDRDSRFQTARDFQTALAKFQFQFAQTRKSLPPDSESVAQWMARNISREPHKVRSRPPTAPSTPSALESALHSDESTHNTSDSTKLAATRGELRERKPVYVLDGCLSGLDLLRQRIGDDKASSLIADFYGVAKDIAFKHDASLEETSETGLRLIVGVPVSSDDDASRTTRLALDLIEALDGIASDIEPELRLAVGIERGTAIVSRDKDGRYTHKLEEESASSAAELARDARGAEVLVTGEIYRVCKDEWNFEALGGTRSSAHIGRFYRLRSRKERVQRLQERSQGVALIGRDLQLKALRDAYRETLIHGAQKLIVITGEPGVGKRSLVNALLDNIPKAEASVMRATARAATRYTPYGIIADFGRDAIGLAEGADPSEIQHRIEMLGTVLWPNRSETEEVRELIDATCLLFGIRRDKSPDLNSTELRARLRKIANRLEMRFAPDRPLIVVAENVHWVDEQSLALYTELLKNNNTRGILVLITSRPEPSIIKLASEANADVIRLDELDEVSRELFVEKRFVKGDVHQDLVKQVLARTGGNPFFISEVLDSLVDRGILIEEPAGSEHTGLLRWSRKDVPIQIPSSVEALLATRIDQLPGELKQTLVYASVLGARFREAELRDLLQTPVDDQLNRLVERGLLSLNNQGYSFPNDMTMTVAYRMVPPDDRSQLHKKAALNIKGGASYRPGQDDAYVARHLELAGDSEAAAKDYVRAAVHAIHVGGMGDAFYHLGRALKLFAPHDHDARFQTLLHREMVLRRQAKRPQQLREINALRVEAEAVGKASMLAVAHARLTDYYIDLGKLQDASKSVVPALEFARQSGDDLIVAEALRLQSSILRHQGQSEKALAVCGEALALIDARSDALESRAQLLNNRGTVLWNMNRLGEAIESYAETLVIYKNLRQPRQEARALNNMGIVFSALGESESALAHYKRSLRIDQRLGDRAQIALKLGNIGQTYTELGDDKRGEKYLLKALKLSEAHQDWTSMLDILNSLGQVYLARRDLGRASNFLERGLDLAHDSRNHYQEIRSLVYLAFTRIEQGDGLAEARALAKKAVTMAKSAPMPVGAMYGLAAQALACDKLGEREESLALSHQAVEQLARIEHSEGLEFILSIHTTICENNQLLDEAKDAIRKSREEVTRKAAKLDDPDLRQCYLQSHTIASICADFDRLCGAGAV